VNAIIATRRILNISNSSHKHQVGLEKTLTIGNATINITDATKLDSKSPSYITGVVPGNQ